MIDPWFSLQLSLLVASIATGITALLGIVLGYFFARTEFSGKHAVDALCMLPLVLPPTVVGFFLLALLSRHGVIGGPLYNLTGWSPIFTWQAAVIAAAVVALPLMIRTSRSAIESVDPVYEKLSYTLGKSRISTIFLVTLPLASRGIIAGVALTFTRALGEFGATLMIAGNIPGKTQTMPLAIYQATQAGEDNLALGLVVLLTVSSFLVLLWLNKQGGKW